MDPLKLVLIDDEADYCLIMKDNLEDTGKFNVVSCSEPLKAEDVIRSEKPDILLVDEVMPDRKGDEIVKAVRKNPDFKSLMIIMVSGRGEMVYNKKKDSYKWQPNSAVVKNRGDLPEGGTAEALAEAYGVDDYVSKPFTTDILVNVIEDVIKLRRKKPEAESGSEM